MIRARIEMHIMNIGVVVPEEESAVVSGRALVRDFAETAGRRGIVASAYVVAGALLESVGISLLVPLLGLIFNTNAMPRWLAHGASTVFAAIGAETAFERLAVLLALFGVLMALRALTIAARDGAIVTLQVNFVEAQRLRIARSLAVGRWEYIARLRHARIAHLMSGDIQRLGIGVQFLLQVAAAIVLLAAQCALLFLLAPAFALAVPALLIAGLFLLGPMLGRARSLGGYVVDANLSLLNSTTQFLGGLKLAVSQDLAQAYVEEAGETLHRLADRQVEYAKRHIRGQAAMALLSAVACGVLILVGFAWLHIPPPALIALLVVAMRMTGPAGQVHQGTQQFGQVLAIYERVRALECELASADRGSLPRAAAADAPQGLIVFTNVSYRHGDIDGARGRGLENFDLAIAPGEFLGVVGPSGSGKTTFADLLVGLYPPQSGRIVIGDRVLDSAMLAAWRRSLSYVSQDPFLFHDTLRRNLAWAEAGADEAAMWRALALAGADGFVRRMENGLDTVVGERGTLVSGGERQRFALARALVRNPRLLVLDEATSAIDIPGERDVLARLRALKSRPTIVLIAHRTDNLDQCDRILRFESVR
jgi:ATP-binding cassette, subfamily C, bacterial